MLLRTNRQIEQVRMTVQATAAIDEIRHETHQGVDHLVVPMIVLTEGVLSPSNASAPELALASEYGRHPGGWDGRPVVFDHPVRDGIQVSANSPDIIENEAFGQLFNTHLDGVKLKTEAWINLEKVGTLSQDVQDAIADLETDNGEITEVSTGLFVSLESFKGEFQGEVFNSIWRDVVPDHLAILPKGTIGACSVEDGCGAPRINASRVICGEGCTCEVCRTASDSPSLSVQATNPEEGKKGLFQGLMEKFQSVMRFRSQGLSDDDTRNAIEAGLRKLVADDFIWIVAVFQSEGTFVYEQGFDGKALSRSFEIDDSGDISIGEVATEVRPETTFVPVSVPQEENPIMVNKEKVSPV